VDAVAPSSSGAHIGISRLPAETYATVGQVNQSVIVTSGRCVGSMPATLVSSSIPFNNAMQLNMTTEIADTTLRRAPTVYRAGEYVTSTGVAPIATIGFDTNLDGQANFQLSGADRSFNGIPDFLEVGMGGGRPAVVLGASTSAYTPSATIGFDTNLNGRPNFVVSGADRNFNGIPDFLGGGICGGRPAVVLGGGSTAKNAAVVAGTWPAQTVQMAQPTYMPQQTQVAQMVQRMATPPQMARQVSAFPQTAPILQPQFSQFSQPIQVAAAPRARDVYAGMTGAVQMGSRR